MADFIVSPNLVDQSYKLLQGSSGDELLERAFDGSELAQQICVELWPAIIELTAERAPCEIVLGLCKRMFTLGFIAANVARQNALAGSVR